MTDAPAPKPYVVDLATGEMTGGNPGYVQRYDRDTGEIEVEVVGPYDAKRSTPDVEV